MDSSCPHHTDVTSNPHVLLPARRRRPLARILHRIYKLTLSPFIGRSCRFTPTCSDYGLEAVERFGWMRGGWKAIKRICRCQPLCNGGHDPVV